VTAPVNPCTVRSCRNKINAAGLCKAHEARLERYGDVLAHIPIRAPEMYGRQDRAMHGPFFCVCAVSEPDPKCCRLCGYPCVHRMAPQVRDLALAKMPTLVRQVIAVERGVA